MQSREVAGSADIRRLGATSALDEGTHMSGMKKPGEGQFSVVVSPAERFWPKVDKSGECWVWTASRVGNGYGEFWDGKRKVAAHRWAYENLVGPIPEGMQLDHLCRTRLCVRADHLEPVTQQENIRRGDSGRMWREKTHCPSGHPYDEVNTNVYRGRRYCRACLKAWKAAH